MAPHSSTLAWKIPRTEEPGGLQSMGSLSRTRLSDLTFTFHFHVLEKEMATHSSILAWRIPGTEEPVGLLSMGLHRVRHNWHNLAAVAAAEARLYCCKIPSYNCCYCIPLVLGVLFFFFPHLSLGIFKISSWISSMFYWVFSIALFKLKCLCFPYFFFLLVDF